MNIDLVAGARPNFMKLAPVERAIRNLGTINVRIIHTGQHYDPEMNEVFFSELGIPNPDAHLGAGSGTHGAQTARILESYERLLLEDRPDATVVFGDVNSTIACALAAVKLGVRVVHVEAGLRSFDRSMPEEINRVLTDAIADCLLVSEPSGVDNLIREGIPAEMIHLVGNVMIDTLIQELNRSRALDYPAKLGLSLGEYGLVTLHRPANVDDPVVLKRLVDLFVELATHLPLVFPIHPRTQTALKRANLLNKLQESGRILCLNPISYRENLALMEACRVVLTDSGGMQEETAVLNIPCLTMRPNTERPVTVSLGTSRLVGNNAEQIRIAFTDVIEGRWAVAQPVPLWDGHAGERVACVIEHFLHSRH